MDIVVLLVGIITGFFQFLPISFNPAMTGERETLMSTHALEVQFLPPIHLRNSYFVSLANSCLILYAITLYSLFAMFSAIPLLPTPCKTSHSNSSAFFSHLFAKRHVLYQGRVVFASCFRARGHAVSAFTIYIDL